MRVALVCINAKYIHFGLAPWYLAAAIQDAGRHEGVVVEGSLHEPTDQTLRRVALLAPDAVCLSAYIWNIECLRELIPAIRAQLPQARIILGGPEVSFDGAYWLSELPQVEAILSGEGEESLPLLLDRMEEGAGFGDVPGCCYWQEGRVVQNPPRSLLQDPPSPYRQGYFSALNGRMAYLETTRGCPFSCAFCLSGRKDNVRFFDLEQAKENLVRLANAPGVKTVKLIDRTFNCHAERADQIFSFLMEEYGRRIPPTVCFHFEIGADLLTPQTLALLNRAPCGYFQFEAGIQSFSERTLAAVSRRCDMRRLEENLKQLIAPHNAHVHVDLIAGLPYEGMKEFEQSFDRAYALRPQMLQLGFLKLLRGSALRERAEEYGIRYSERAPYEILESQWMGREELLELKRIEDVLQRMYNSGRFRNTAEYLLQQCTTTPFALYRDIAGWLLKEGCSPCRVSLDEYTQWIYAYGRSRGMEGSSLRDSLVIDRMVSSRAGKPPAFLQRQDPDYALIHKGKGKDTGAALLYSGGEKRVLTVDYAAPKDIDGRFPYRIDAWKS